SVRESRSMADTEEKQAKKPDKQRPLDPEAAAKAEKKAARQDKAAAAAGKADKADKAEKKARGPEPRVPARLKVQFEEAIRNKLTEQFGYKNRLQVPVLDKIVINM